MYNIIVSPEFPVFVTLSSYKAVKEYRYNLKQFDKLQYYFTCDVEKLPLFLV